MNDRTATEPPREIVLAREAPFRLARTTVRPPSLEVEFESETTSLEPRVMKVLVALGRMGGQPVSRESLIELCWAGRVVTDGALNRSIAQLRKALRDPGIQIETIPTVGYRLQAGTSQAASEQEAVRHDAAEQVPVGHVTATNTSTAEALDRGAAQTAARPPIQGSRVTTRRVPAALLVIAAVLVLGATVWWLIGSNRPPIWTASEFRPLTATADQETYPALSPDGTQIVYSSRPDAYSARSLYLRNVDEGTPVRLTSDAGDDFGAAWSPDGTRVAFFRATQSQPCALVVVPVPGGPERVVTTCRPTSAESRPSWLDARTLVFSDQPDPIGLSRIRAVDIGSGEVRDLTSPALSTMGDFDPQAAPDGRHILFRRTVAIGADDLMALDAATGEAHALINDGWKASGYVWSANGDSIFFSSNRGGDFGLWSADVHGGAPPRRVALGLGTISFTRMSADRRNRIAVEFTRGQNKLARFSVREGVQLITAGAGSDGDPAVAADGSVAHVSNRGGSYEIWLLREGAPASRLTQIQGSYVLEPHWSRDRQRIVFVGVKGRSAEIYSVARDGSKLRQLTNDGVTKRDPVFSASGDRLYYLARVEGSWRLMALDLPGRVAPRAVGGNQRWYTLRAAPDGTIYGRQEGKGSVERIHPLPNDAGSGIPGNALVPDAVMERPPHITDADSWAVGSDGIYVRRGRRVDESSSLWFHPWRGEPRKLADVPLAWGNIAVDPEGRVLFSQSTSAEVDLAMVELQAQN